MGRLVKPRDAVRWRQCVMAAAMAALAGCGGPTAPLGEVESVEGFIGGAVGDEPRAALVARDILSSGGSAADAVVAQYFTMAVTYPNAAGLGGGGVCVVYDREKNKAEALEFLPQTTQASARVAVPGVVRGLSALHARYGRLRWGQVVSPAENLARFGHPMSRALSRAVGTAGPSLVRDPGYRDQFMDSAKGVLKGEGDRLQLVRLAAVLTAIRTRGAGEFYGGQTAKALVADAANLGGGVTVNDLRVYAPRWKPTETAKYGNNTIHSVPRPAGGQQLTSLWSSLDRRDRYLDTSAAMRPLEFARVVGELLGGAALATSDGGSSGLVAVDRDGMAVACVATMLRRFGTGQTGATTGIGFAPASPAEMDHVPFLAPVIMTNSNVKELFLAGAASGGGAGLEALMQVVLGAVFEQRPLNEAIAAPRVARLDRTGRLQHEDALPVESVRSLEGLGLPLAGGARLGRVNMIYCPASLPNHPDSCAFETDPRGFGLATR